jgi:hypothetical protein
MARFLDSRDGPFIVGLSLAGYFTFIDDPNDPNAMVREWNKAPKKVVAEKMHSMDGLVSQTVYSA